MPTVSANEVYVLIDGRKAPPDDQDHLRIGMQQPSTACNGTIPIEDLTLCYLHLFARLDVCNILLPP